MKKMIVMRILLLAMLILLAACVNVKQDEKKLTVVKNEGVIKIALEEKAVGATIKIEGKIPEDKIKIDSGKLKMVKYNNESTFVSITGNGEEFNNLFEIIGMDIKEVVLVESCKSSDISIKIGKGKVVRSGEILLGDFNSDKTVDIVDFQKFKEAYGTTESSYDIAPADKGITAEWGDIYCSNVKDGKVNILDLCVFSYNYLKVIPVEEKELQSVTVTGSGVINAGSSVSLTAIAKYSDNSIDSSVNWSSSDGAVATVDALGNVYGVKAGVATITATKTVNNITKSGSVSITVNSVENGITIYIEEGYGDGIYTWLGSATTKKEFTGAWPGSKYTVVAQKEKTFYKIFFKDLTEVNYIIMNGTGKLTGDQNTTQNIWLTKDGKKNTENPFDYRPAIIVSPEGGTNKGDKEISIIVTGDGVTAKSATFNGKAIQLTSETTKIKLSDYLKDKESGTLSLSATNSEGTKTKSVTFLRDDSYVVPVIEAYGTLEPFAKEAIYFLMTDRFVNGDTTNDYKEQGKSVGHGTWDIPLGGGKDNIGYMGGDFKGVYNNADYITSMGFGAVWVTPIIDQPDEAFTGGTDCTFQAGPGADKGKTGYHGYWGVNFYKLDEHLPSADMDFKSYTSKMKEKGLKTVLDIVCNHASPAFTMEEAQYSRLTSKYGRLFDENGKEVAASGNIAKGSLWFQGNDQLAQLADFNVANDAVFDYLSNAHMKWVDEGADALRIDTVKHMPMTWWKRFVDKIRAKHPGMYMFGEHFGISSGEMSGYQTGAGMDTLDFPCMGACKNVFGGNGGYDGLSGYLHLDDGVIKNPYTAATFYDNHDMARMNATDEGFIDAHNWLFTTRGVPVIYYGSEMGFQRGTIEHGGNRNYYGTENIAAAKNSKIYKELCKIGKIRKENVALQKGLQINLSLSGKQASFLRVYQHGGVCQTAVVMLNKEDSAKTVTVNKYVTPGTWKDAETGATKEFAGVITAEVPAHGFKVFILNEQITDNALIELCKKLTVIK